MLAPAALLAVVKSDAYGHGARDVARRLERRGIEWLGVAMAEEGVALREAGIATPVLVLGTARREEVELYRRHRLTPTVSSMPLLEMWSEATAGSSETTDLHLKIDTGMSRLGLAPADLGSALERIRQSPGLRLTGLMSHLAEGDVPDSPRNQVQIDRFVALGAELSSAERKRVLLHLANSGGALYQPASRLSVARLGLALYGVDPARRDSGVEGVMSVRCRVVQVRELAAGERAGYGGTWQAERSSRLAVLPLGYGDGYAWRLSNRAEVLIGGRRAPVAGRVSMDMTTVDVTDAGEVAVGDEAVLLGAQGDDRISAWELADRAGTIPWETLCLFGLRLPRVYRG
jgi:alanine racemase